MDRELLNILNIVFATSVVSLFSLVSIYAISLKEKTLHDILLVLIAFSAGTILGASFFDLLPEAIELVKGSVVFIYITVGFLFLHSRTLHLLVSRASS